MFRGAAELHRVYPAVADAAGNAAATPHLAMDDAAALAMAQQGAAMAEEKLGELKTLLNDMRKDRDAWRDQAQGRLHPRLDVCDLRDRRADVRSWSSPFAAKHTNSSIATPERVRIRRGSYTSGLMLIEQYACGPFGLSVSSIWGGARELSSMRPVELSDLEAQRWAPLQKTSKTSRRIASA